MIGTMWDGALPMDFMVNSGVGEAESSAGANTGKVGLET